MLGDSWIASLERHGGFVQKKTGKDGVKYAEIYVNKCKKICNFNGKEPHFGLQIGSF